MHTLLFPMGVGFFKQDLPIPDARRSLTSTPYTVSGAQVFLSPNGYAAQINQDPPYNMEMIFNLLEN